MVKAARMHFWSLPGTLVLVAGLVAAGVLAPVPALAKVALQLTLPVGSSCMSGYKPTLDPIKVKLLRSDGKALETAHDDSALLTWQLCFQHHVPVAGEKLQMINGTDQDRTITVPRLTLNADRVSSVVSGHGPAGKSLSLSYTDCYPAGCDAAMPLSATANSHGRYHRNLSASSIDIDGWDEVGVIYQNIHGDQFRRDTLAPYFEVTKPNRILVTCLPPGTTNVRLLSSSGALRASRSFHSTSDCSAFFGSFRKNGHAVSVHTGDRITSDLATDARLVWPSISVNGLANTLSGRCFAHVRWAVFVSRSSVPTLYSGMTDSTGHFSMTTGWTFQPGDTLDLICESGPGDHVRLTVTI